MSTKRVSKRVGAVVKTITSAAKPARKPRATAAKTSGPRRVRTDDSETRERLLDAAEQLMREEGYAAVTTRRIGAQAGVHPQLVHYYFSGIDDLFLALWRRFTGHYLARQAQAFVSPNPIRTVWEHDVDHQGASLTAELMALARHRKTLGDQIASDVEKFRVMQASALGQAMQANGLKEIFGTPEALALCMVGLARILVVEESLGISSGHADARAAMARWLDQLDVAARPQSGAKRDAPT
jgi:AcrR family transcriptional regulator